MGKYPHIKSEQAMVLLMRSNASAAFAGDNNNNNNNNNSKSNSNSSRFLRQLGEEEIGVPLPSSSAASSAAAASYQGSWKAYAGVLCAFVIASALIITYKRTARIKK